MATSTERKHLRTLERRRDHLAKTLSTQLVERESTGRPINGFLQLELNALNWAIDRLRLTLEVEDALR